MPTLRDSAALARAFAAQHGVALPDDYRAFYEAGLVDFTNADPEALQLACAEWADPLDASCIDGAIMVAADGTGNFYGYYPPWTRGGEMPLVLSEHETNEGIGFAPSFAAAVFRLLAKECAASATPRSGDRRAANSASDRSNRAATERAVRLATPHLPRALGEALGAMLRGERELPETLAAVAFPELGARVAMRHR